MKRRTFLRSAVGGLLAPLLGRFAKPALASEWGYYQGWRFIRITTPPIRYQGTLVLRPYTHAPSDQLGIPLSSNHGKTKIWTLRGNRHA